ncbi:endosomal/vacuolar adapter protein Ypt35p [Monosporozyma unispora]|nr:PX domain-containing protein ypt35 [Kazachstania unispora]
MSDKLTFLPPEPIKLIDEEADESEELLLQHNGDNHNPSISTFDITNRRRSNSAINSKYNFLKAFIGNSTVIRGNNGSKYMVWKITIVLKPRIRNINTDQDHIASPQIEIYKRYSEIDQFRTDLVNHINMLKQQDNPDNVRLNLTNIKIPELPPKVPWYDMWQYNDVNFNKKWLLKRRKGIEYFLNYVLLNKYIVESCQEIIKSFIHTLK